MLNDFLCVFDSFANFEVQLFTWIMSNISVNWMPSVW